MSDATNHDEKSVRDAPKLGATFKPHTLRKLDGRTREAKRLHQISRELIEHCGGADRISAAQRFLAERTAIDLLRLELYDAEMTAGTISAHDARVCHALRNTVRLALRELGMMPRDKPAPHLSDVLARYRKPHKADGSAAA